MREIESEAEELMRQKVVIVKYCISVQMNNLGVHRNASL